MGRNILVVDDELSVRELLYDAFTKEGYKVTTIGTAIQAIEVVAKDKPDLVLLDFNMPQMNGIEVLKRIRARDANVKVVMLTGIESTDLEKEARLNGASGFLRKNLGLEVIIKAVNDIFSVKRPYGHNKIMVVDDDASVSSLIKDFFTKKGYEVITADNGQEALDKFSKERPLIILLDVRLTGMDGLLILKRIREIDDKVGVIMVTGVKDEEVFEEAKKLGAYEYIVKPFDLSYLETCVLVRICLVSAQLQ